MKPLAYHARRVLDLASFLSRFTHVTGGHPNAQGVRQYSAWCPAHETHHASLNIGATRDGRYLVHCHAGCDVHSIMAAVGLTVRDLYPDGGLTETRIAPLEHTQSHQIERSVLDIAQADRAAGKRLSDADKAREKAAWIALQQTRQWPPEARS